MIPAITLSLFILTVASGTAVVRYDFPTEARPYAYTAVFAAATLVAAVFVRAAT